MSTISYNPDISPLSSQSTVCPAQIHLKKQHETIYSEHLSPPVDEEVRIPPNALSSSSGASG